MPDFTLLNLTFLVKVRLVEFKPFTTIFGTFLSYYVSQFDFITVKSSNPKNNPDQ